MEENFENFLTNYFGPGYGEEIFGKWGSVIDEIRLYFEDDAVGGWSSCYFKFTWNDETRKNDANLRIFDLLLKIDIKNGADISKIVLLLCHVGAFEAVRVRESYFHYQNVPYLSYYYYVNKNSISTDIICTHEIEILEVNFHYKNFLSN